VCEFLQEETLAVSKKTSYSSKESGSNPDEPQEPNTQARSKSPTINLSLTTVEGMKNNLRVLTEENMEFRNFMEIARPKLDSTAEKAHNNGLRIRELAGYVGEVEDVVYNHSKNFLDIVYDSKAKLSMKTRKAVGARTSWCLRSGDDSWKSLQELLRNFRIEENAVPYKGSKKYPPKR
jgi:hypothetical protein